MTDDTIKFTEQSGSNNHEVNDVINRNGSDGHIEAYNSAGERFVDTDVKVQPVEFVWREYD